jgi:twitching motility protein PilT
VTPASTPSLTGSWAKEREQTKSFLSQSLLAVITQVLAKTTDGQGRKAVCEVMVMTKAIAKLIQTDQTHQIPSQLQMGREFGMQLMDQALLSAVVAKEIDPDHAYSFATDKRVLQKYVTDTGLMPKLDPTMISGSRPVP